jgi:hypothetical protein
MRKQLQLTWARLTLHRRELRAIALTVTFAIAALFAAVHVRFPASGSSASFGPGWDCAQVPDGEPICVKRIAPMAPGAR